jgi:hypothetical protein
MESNGNIYNYIRELISAGKSDEAIKQMIGIIDSSKLSPDLADSLSLLSHQFMDIKQKKLLNLGYDQANENLIIHALLSILRKMEENPAQNISNNTTTKNSFIESKKSYDLKFSLAISGVIISSGAFIFIFGFTLGITMTLIVLYIVLKSFDG